VKRGCQVASVHLLSCVTVRPSRAGCEVDGHFLNNDTHDVVDGNRAGQPSKSPFAQTNMRRAELKRFKWRHKTSAVLAAVTALFISTQPRLASAETVLKLAYGSEYVMVTPALAKKFWNGIKSQFESTHPGVTVKLMPIPGGFDDIVTKISMSYADSQSAPDVAQCPRRKWRNGPRVAT
jgi:hypothetical protein